MLDKDQWKRTLQDIILRDRDFVAGPAGETPMVQLSEEIRRLSDDDSDELANAFADLIKKPPRQSEHDEAYWKGISFLLHDLGKRWRRTTIRDALLVRILGNEMPEHLKVFALRGYVAVGGRFDPSELNEALLNIKEGSPLDWLFAAVRSSQFDMAARSIEEMLREGRLPIGPFLLALDSLLDHWARDVDIGRLVRGFMACVPKNDKDGVRIFDSWLMRRGHTIQEAAAVVSNGRSQRSQTDERTVQQRQNAEWLAREEILVA